MSRTVLPLACALVLGAAAPVASAAETRAEYVAQADAICKSAAPAYKALFRRAKKNAPKKEPQGTKRELRVAARWFGKLMTGMAKVEAGTTNRLSALAPAPGDEPAVAGWLAGSRQSDALMAAAGRAGRKGKFSVMLGRMVIAALVQEEADAYVKAFGFRYCVATRGQVIAAAASYAQDSGS